MLIDRSHWRMHALPACTALLLSLLLIGWYAIASWSRGSWLGGGSLPGLVLGTVAALIILFEMALWPRKLLRRMRLFPTRYWMSAHIWFGLACLPIAIAHSGLHWGGWLTTLLMWLLIVTVASGAVGLALQNIIPKWMLRQIPAETIHLARSIRFPRRWLTTCSRPWPIFVDRANRPTNRRQPKRGRTKRSCCPWRPNRALTARRRARRWL